MATATPLHHPRRNASTTRQGRFPYRATLYAQSGSNFAPVGAMTNLPCAFKPAQGSESGPMQSEAPVSDVVLILGHYPNISAKSNRVKVTRADGSTLGEFGILDRLDGDSGQTTTMLIVTPHTSKR